MVRRKGKSPEEILALLHEIPEDQSEASDLSSDPESSDDDFDAEPPSSDSEEVNESDLDDDELNDLLAGTYRTVVFAKRENSVTVVHHTFQQTMAHLNHTVVITVFCRVPILIVLSF